jgi:hypothetical protein
MGEFHDGFPKAHGFAPPKVIVTAALRQHDPSAPKEPVRGAETALLGVGAWV